jgi:hypothetical protein
VLVRTAKDTSCPECHNAIIVADSGFVSTRIFNKAWQFLQVGEYTISTIMGAMAVESELARLYIKWREIDSGLLPNEVTDDHRAGFDDELRGHFKIIDRLDMLSTCLTKVPFNEFIVSRTDLSALVANAHPNSTGQSLKKYFEAEVFWKRNLIVHFGKIDSTADEAQKMFAGVRSLFTIFEQMDTEKIRSMN